MNSIGGYFELELQQNEHYHQNALKLNTARNCLEYILRAKQYKKIFIPYYTCEVILEPIKKLRIDYEFYNINQQLEPVKKYNLLNHEAFLYTNYFGLKQEAVKYLANIYNSKLIIDNSLAFYAKPLKGIDTFYSARKFFGVPDGAYLYTNKILDEIIEQDFSFKRMSHLLKRIDLGAEFGYDDFKRNDALLINQPIKKMSELTEKILKSINYQNVKEIRKENYNYLHNKLINKNQLSFLLDDDSVPLVYPFYSEEKKIKERLIQAKIYVATYWKNVFNWCEVNSLEYSFAENTVFLPIDQRCKFSDLNTIVDIIYEG